MSSILRCLSSTYESEFAFSVVTNTLDFELSVCAVSTNESDFELSADLVSVNAKSNFKPYVGHMLINEPAYVLSVHPVLVSESAYELFASPVSVSESAYELFTSPVSVSEPAYIPSFHSVVTRGTFD